MSMSKSSHLPFSRSLRAALGPLMQQRLVLEQQRDQLNRDIRAKDADIQRNQKELAQVKARIVAAGKELKEQETTLWALRRGDVAIRSGQPLWIDKVTLQNPSQSKEVIQALLNKANEMASILVLPGQNCSVRFGRRLRGLLRFNWLFLCLRSCVGDVHARVGSFQRYALLG